MAKGKKINLMQSGKVAGVVTGAALLLNWIVATLLKQTVEPLFSAVPVVSPITSTLGSKVLGLVGGLPFVNAFAFGLIATFLTSLAIVLLGEQLIDWFRLPTLPKLPLLNKATSRLASVILYGSVPLYLLLVVPLIAPTIMSVIGVVVYAVLVSVVATTIAGLMKLKI